MIQLRDFTKGVCIMDYEYVCVSTSLREDYKEEANLSPKFKGNCKISCQYDFMSRLRSVFF